MKKKTVSGVTALTMLVSATLPTHASQIEEVNGMPEAIESEVVTEEALQPEVVIQPEVVPVEPEVEGVVPKQEVITDVAPIATEIEVGTYDELKNAVVQSDVTISITGDIQLKADEQLRIEGDNVVINGNSNTLDLNETNSAVKNKFMVDGENVTINELAFEGYTTVGVYVYKSRATKLNNLILKRKFRLAIIVGNLYNFLYKLREIGVTVPVIPGIMPITKGNQVDRAIKLSGSHMPQRFKALVDKFGDDPDAMKQAGIAYATDQIIDLYANGITNVHVYSMNKPDVAAKIQSNNIVSKRTINIPQLQLLTRCP